MNKTILPSGEEVSVTPEELLMYLDPDGIRQLLHQERLRWNLKPNKDCDYYDNTKLYKYNGEIYNEGLFQRMEIRTFPDNGAYAGYSGINIDSGLFGFVHNLEKWDKCISKESINEIVNRCSIGAMAKIPGKHGYGLNDNNEITTDTDNRMAAFLFDPFDGRTYLYSNDDPNYVNNETRNPEDRLPARTVARVGDIPTRITQLKNDLDFISDPDYRHTDNNFNNSNRFVLDNLDDRTFVYPEISKYKNSDEYIENYRVGLNGEFTYGEGDCDQKFNTQSDLGVNKSARYKGDHLGDQINSHNANKKFSGVNHKDGYFPGVFRSLEELERVDLVDQLMTPLTHNNTPGARRVNNYYSFDGVWSPNWFDRHGYDDSYKSDSLNPNNMEINIKCTEPVPYGKLLQKEDPPFNRCKLYQWRYNRITTKYYSKDITINIVESGEQYRVGDILRWTFGDDVFLYTVTMVGANGQIQKGRYKSERERIFEQDPSTHGVGLPFSNMTGVGHGALLSVSCKVSIETVATQIKNNLYAYVDVTPSVRSDNTSPWSDVNEPNIQDGKVYVRSTAVGPAYSGINSGRGGPQPAAGTNAKAFYEHGGNATAGAHVHLFRYVIDTLNPSWEERDGIKVYLGKWVDQGPLGVERPCDIKALLFSNPDTNNFNNYYKFMLDSLLDNMQRDPDEVKTNNKNTTSHAYFHVAQCDPESDQKFYDSSFDPITSQYVDMDITNKVLYINAATGVMFIYNSTIKNDPTFGYGYRPIGWIPISGFTSR